MNHADVCVCDTRQVGRNIGEYLSALCNILTIVLSEGEK